MRDGRIPESAKRQVIKRCIGNCEFCGKPMTAIQNFGSGCNRPLHLRAVCDGCAKTKAFCDPEFTQNPEFRSTVASLAGRVFSTSPMRICDDYDNWNWREFVAGRRS